LDYVAAGICGGTGPGASEAVERMVAPPLVRGGAWTQLCFPEEGVHMACEAQPRAPGLLPHGPARSEDGRSGAVFAGWLHNAAALQREHPGQPTAADLLLRLYEAHGEGLVTRLDGRWVFALWDGRRRRLLLARDATGQRVVYHLRDGRGLFFASRIKSLIRSGRSSGQLNPGSIDTLLTLRRVPGTSTVVQGIERLAPGHSLRWQGGELQLDRFFDLEPAVRPMSLPVARERFGALARRVVADACPTGQRVGVYFSGGIDSTTLLDLVHRQTAGHVEAFTFLVGKDHGDFLQAREYAARHGIAHQEVDSREVPFEQVYPEALWVLDDPVADLSIINPFMMARTASQRVRFSVDGVGPDQVLGGCFYHRPMLYLLRYGSRPGVARLLRLASRLVSASPVEGLHRLMERLEPAYSIDPDGRRRISQLLALADRPREVAPLLLGLLQQGQRRGLYTPDFAEQVDRAGYWQPPEAIGSGGPAEEQMLRLFRFEVEQSLPHCQCRVSESFGHYHGLEHGAPFMAPALLRFLFELPFDLRIRGLQNKVLLRGIQRARNERVHRQPKQAGNIALDRIWGRRIISFCADVLTPDRLRQGGLFQPQAVEQLFAQAEARPTMFPCMSLVAVASVELWRRLFLDRSY
jgi:asparagine synthase (glutamine-hydrolysing)